jgi:hypothetical protein
MTAGAERERDGMLFDERQNSDLLFVAADERWRAEVRRLFGYSGGAANVACRALRG